MGTTPSVKRGTPLAEVLQNWRWDVLQEFGTCISLTPTGIQFIVTGMSLIKIPEYKKEGKKIPE